MGFLAFLFYIGGALAWADKRGFWQAIVWPYHLGAFAARAALQPAEDT
jgi:hypothetical protein